MTYDAVIVAVAGALGGVGIGLLVREPWRRLAGALDRAGTAEQGLGTLRGRHQVIEAQAQQLARELGRARASAQATARELYAIQEDLSDAITSGALEAAGVDVRVVLGRMLQAEAAAAYAAASAEAGIDDAVPPGGGDAGDAAATAETSDVVPADPRELLGRLSRDLGERVDAGGEATDAGGASRLPTDDGGKER